MGFETFRSPNNSGGGTTETKEPNQAKESKNPPFLEETIIEGACVVNHEGVRLPEWVSEYKREEMVIFTDHNGNHRFNNDPKTKVEEKMWPLH